MVAKRADDVRPTVMSETAEACVTFYRAVARQEVAVLDLERVLLAVSVLQRHLPVMRVVLNRQGVRCSISP
jgi:hypothetical protein